MQAFAAREHSAQTFSVGSMVMYRSMPNDMAMLFGERLTYSKEKNLTGRLIKYQKRQY